MKKAFGVLLTCVLLLVSLMTFPSVVQALDSDDFQYSIEDSTITITGYVGFDPTVTVPETINGIPVTHIFSIGHSAYWAGPEGALINRIDIPKPVVAIRPGAFGACTTLTSIHVDPANEFYQSHDGILYDKSLQQLVCYPIDRAGDQFVIPDGVTQLADYAFLRCKNVQKVTIPGTIRQLGKGIFAACLQLDEIVLSEGIMQISDHVFTGSDCVKTIQIPASVASISQTAFGQTAALHSGNWEYSSGLLQLEEIRVDPGSAHYASPEGVLYDKAMTTLIRYPENRPGDSYVIPSGVQMVADSAFLNGTKLTQLNIPDSVTCIGRGAFSGCGSLKTLRLPPHLAELSDFLCTDCSNLVQIEVPEQLVSIGDEAFSGCSRLTKVSLPASLSSIGRYAFHDCWSLAEIDLPDSLAVMGEGAFSNCEKLVRIVIPPGLQQINDRSFSECNGLISVTIPFGVSQIGDYAFNSCDSLTQLSIPDSVETIGWNAFYYCANLQSVRLPDRLSQLENETFANCTKLAGITLPARINAIASDAFLNCSSLQAIDVVADNPTYSSQDGVLYNKSGSSLIKYPEAVPAVTFVIPDRVTFIESQAFSFVANLQRVTIPASVKLIGPMAFLACSNLESAHFLGNEPLINEAAFKACNQRFTIYYLAGRTGFKDLDYPVLALKTGSLAVTFKDWDGKTLLVDLVDYGQSATAPADPVRKGYAFAGWDQPFDAVLENLTVTAQYEANLDSESREMGPLLLVGAVVIAVILGSSLALKKKR